MGYTNNEKPKMVGSIYFNSKKGTDPQTVERGKKAIEFLQQNGFNFAMSIKNAATGSYDEYTAFFNGFKKSDKDRDLSIYPKLKSNASKQAPAPRQSNTNDDMPF